jgi:hypothetical protein
LSGPSAGQSCPGAIKARTTACVLPPDPDLDDLPDELWRHRGPLKIVGEDEDGNVWEAPITREELAPMRTR